MNERLGYPVFNALVELTRVIGEQQKFNNNESGWELTLVEPDLTHKVALNAWVISGCKLENINGPQGQRDVAEDATTVQYEIGVDGSHMQDNEKVMLQAQRVLDDINEVARNPYAPEVVDLDEMIEIGQYEGADMSRYTMSWKDVINPGLVLPGAKLYVRRADQIAYQEAIQNPQPVPPEWQSLQVEPASETVSTVMDINRLDSAE